MNLDGLNRLAEIGADILIAGNDTLNSLEALALLDSIPGSVSIGRYTGGGPGGAPVGSASLASLAGLHHVRFIGGNFSLIGYLKVLTSLSGLSSLRTVEGSVAINANHGLGNLNGLENLQTIGNNLVFSSPFGNDGLTSLNGLENLQSIGGSLVLNYYTALADFSGLEQLQSIGGGVSLTRISALTSMNGLNNLQFIGDNVGFYKNRSLPSLNGLENLVSIVGTLTLEENDSLSQLSGLENVTIGGDLNIYKNKSLTQCEAESICHYLANPAGAIIISNNAPGCNSIPEVEAACLVPAAEAFSDESPLQIFPNPAGDFLQITMDDHEAWALTITDLRGKVLYQCRISGSQLVLLRDWPAGLYMLRAVAGERVFAKRLVKQ